MTTQADTVRRSRLPTVADLRAMKGKRQLSMLRYFSVEEAAAAEEAGIDIASVPPEVLFHPDYRMVAPTIFSMTGQTHLECGTPEDYLRWSGDAINRGADAVYCSGSLQTVEYLAREHTRNLDRRLSRRGQDRRQRACPLARGPRLPECRCFRRRNRSRPG